MACSSKRPFVLSSRREIARAVAKIAEVSGLSSPKGSLWRHPIRHPLFEAVDLFLGPRVVAGHAAVFQAREDAARLRAHVVIRREVEAERLHGLHIGIVAKQGSNISAEAESHESPIRGGGLWLSASAYLAEHCFGTFQMWGVWSLSASTSRRMTTCARKRAASSR